MNLRRFLLYSSSGLAALALMFAITFIAGATLAPRADRLMTQQTTVPDFQFTDQTGQTLSRQNLSGQVWLASFFFSRCNDNCPKMTARLNKLQAMIDPQVKWVSFTMDPAHDTAESLAAYARESKIDSTRWKLLTGPRSEIEKVAAAIRPDARGINPENLTHSDQILLIDPQMHVHNAYNVASDADLRRLSDDAAKLAQAR